MNDEMQKALEKVKELAPSPDPNYASEFHKRLNTLINTFDSSLEQQYEVGIRLVNFGQEITFHLTELGYWNPSLITFKGVTDNEEPIELIQHVTQISILLMKVNRRNPNEPKRPIGFAPWPG
jgi:hypothetical protein